MSKTQVAIIIGLIGLVVMYFTFFRKKADESSKEGERTLINTSRDNVKN